MVSRTTSALNSTAQSFTFNTPTTSDSTDSFTQELATALESYLQQSGGSGQFDISIQPAQGQNSDSGQYVVTVTAPQAAATPSTTSTSSELMGATSSAANVVSTSSASGQSTTAITADTEDSTSSTSSSGGGSAMLPTVPDGGASAPSFQNALQQFENDWSALNPQQVAFQLANAAGTGGGNPTDTVPGTTIAYGDMTQTQQFAYQYALNYGTGGDSLQDFLTQNAGPQTSWNLSYNEIQQNTDIGAALDSSYQVTQNGSPSVIQVPSDPPSTGGSIDNLPNPAMIQYLPADQQAAAEAAIAAEGPYGENIAAALQVYASS